MPRPSFYKYQFSLTVTLLGAHSELSEKQEKCHMGFIFPYGIFLSDVIYAAQSCV